MKTIQDVSRQPEGGGSAAGAALTVLGQINPLIGVAVTLIGAIRAIRDSARAANPTLPDGTFPTDQEVIAKLLTEAGLLKADVAAAREWLKGLPQ